MFTRTFSLGKNRAVRRAVSLVLALGFVIGSLSLAGCPMEGGGGADDHKLNEKLIGSWTASGETEFGTWSDTYTITAGTPPKISHPSSWGDDTSYTNYKDAAIVFVYNFSETAGCLIIKRPDSKYSAVYFKDLTTTSVLLGDAYDSSVTYDPDNPNATDPAVSTLDAAKERFKPANAELYGGGSAQTGTPQTKS